MKRTLAIVIGLVSVAAAVYLGSRLWAQQGNPVPPGGPPATAPAPLRTPVRVVNISYIVKKYNRWLNFQQEYRGIYKRDYEERAKKLKDALDGWTAKLQDPKTAAAERETAEKEVRTLQRQMQELGEDAKQRLGKMEADMIVKIYREIEDEVSRFARASAIELVMHFNDASEQADLYAPANITRKLGQGALAPMYAAPGMDISEHILRNLNSKIPAPAPAGPSSAAPPAPTQGSGAVKPASHVPPSPPPRPQE